MDEALNSKLRPRRQQPVVKKNPEPCITADSSNPIPADQTGLENAAKIRLLSWDEIEHWQQNNRYIIRHYRPATNSYHQSIASLSYLHNQTVNIYSHLLGALAFIICTYILYDVFSSRYHSATMTDAFVFSVFFLGLFACLILSASFHTFNNHSHSISQSFLTLDMAGIVSLIMGSFYPGVYYGFYCEPEFTYIYWTMITVFGLTALIALLTPRFRQKSWQHVRTALFLSMGLSGVIPMAHAALSFGIPQARRQMGWAWFIGEAMFYIGGAIIYIAKVPERFSPGRFDVWGSSHQIFHICVLFGAASHLTGAIRAFDYNHDPSTRRC